MFGPSTPSEGEPELSAFAMAYLYGQAANSLDYDDTLIGHPGAPIIGAIMAAAIRAQLPLDRLLRGIAAGYEAHWFLASSSMPTPERGQQVRSVGVWDTLAAALGVGVALDLPDKELERIVGVAASHSLIPYTGKWYERPVPALKNNLGWAAAGAVLSVDLAQAGQTGVTNALDGDNGMWRMAGSDQWKNDPARAWQPGVLRVGFKRYPACWHIQEYIKSMADALTDLPPNDEIAEITVSGPTEVEKFCRSDIITPADVAFSLPATFSLLISGVEPGPQWDDVDNNSEELRHRSKVRYRKCEDKSVILLTKSGHSRHVPVGTSDHYDPAPWGLDEAGVLEKHRRITDISLQHSLSKGPSWYIPHQLYAAVRSSMLSLQAV
jgi:2-methylcitrate dehydratase PrpD